VFPVAVLERSRIHHQPPTTISLITMHSDTLTRLYTIISQWHVRLGGDTIDLYTRVHA